MGGTDKPTNERQLELGKRIRAERGAIEWSQDDLALESGVHRTYLASLESGRRNPSLDVLCRLAASLKIDVGDLVAGLEKKKGRS
jgi:transcriptional regulator with XRE-family HTH domain